MESYSAKPQQEHTSVYFNSIICEGVVPKTINDIPRPIVDNFNALLRKTYPGNADITIQRFQYLIPYIIQSINWNEYGLALESWQIQYYYQRQRFLDKTKLSYDDFLNHQPMQNALAALKLDPVPSFEFILFLTYYYGLRSELRYSSLEQLNRACNALEKIGDNDTAILDISVNGKHFKITNPSFIKASLLSIDQTILKNTKFINDFNEGSNRDKIRAIDYYIIKTILDYFPIKRNSNSNGLYSQEERNLGLSVLSILGRLPDKERSIECGKDNNATFDKLMRDFKHTTIPFAMELFL